MSVDAVVAKLAAWTEHDFHKDRQLADEVLIADGWQCEPNAEFEGGERWFWGTNPQYSSGGPGRPHPVNDMNAAIGVVPFGKNWSLSVSGNYAVAHVGSHSGTSSNPTIALLIAALKCRPL